MPMNDQWTKADNLVIYYYIEAYPDITGNMDLARKIQSAGIGLNRSTKGLSQHISKLRNMSISVPDPVHNFS